MIYCPECATSENSAPINQELCFVGETQFIVMWSVVLLLLVTLLWEMWSKCN